MSNLFEDNDLAKIRQVMVQKALEDSRKEKNDLRKVEVLRSAIEDLRRTVSESVVDNVDIKNFDEVKLHLRTELNRAVTPLLKELERLRFSSDKIDKIREEIDMKNAMALQDNYYFQVVKKPETRIIVDNLRDIVFPDSMDINNLEELQNYFRSLEGVIRETFNVQIPEPKVNVSIPPQEMPNVDLSQLKIDQILKMLEPLKYLSDRAKKPLSVRLSDGNKFIKELTKIVKEQGQQVGQYVSSSMSAGDFKEATKSVSRAGGITSGRLALSNAGTAVQVTSSSTPIAWVDCTADAGQIAIGDSSCQMTSQTGTIVTPGNTPVRLHIKDLSDLYAAGASGTALTYTYYTY